MFVVESVGSSVIEISSLKSSRFDIPKAMVVTAHAEFPPTVIKSVFIL